jgi:hypothetical protein
MEALPLATAPRRKRALMSLGNTLVEGPQTIHEKEKVGVSYLSSVFNLFWHDAAFTTFRSCRIYCDACGDEDSGFRNPLARIAEWERQGDVLDVNLSWPNVDVKLIEIPLDCPEIQREVTRVQALADQSHLTTFGLPTRRDPGGIAAGPSAHLRVGFQAGWQTVSRALWLSEATECINVLDSVSAVVTAFGAPATLGRWIERYDQSFDSIIGSARWLWDFQAGCLDGRGDEPPDAMDSRQRPV